MRRDPTPWLLLLLLTLLAGVALLTRNPDHPLLDRLAETPGVGPAARWFRDVYRASPPAPAEVAEEPGFEVVVVGERAAEGAPEPEPSPPLGSVWVRAGTELRAAPDDGSAVAGTVERIGRMVLRERRGDWSRVSRTGLEGSFTEGWVRSAELREPSPEELWEPEPVLPLPATGVAEEAADAARRLMGADIRRLSCGPYPLLTDAAGPVVDGCARLAGGLDGIYAARTGLESVGPPAETILLFDSQGAYLLFRASVSPDSGREAFASPAGGFVALAVAGRPPRQVWAMLLHELVHLLNRRFLGPALPAWVDEGLAEELGMSRIEADGTPVPGGLGGFESGDGEIRVVGGGRVHLADVRAALRRGELPRLRELLALDRAGFQSEERYRLHYSLSAFWVRYLLSDESPAGAAGFRSFLAAVAAGERLEGDLLLSRLGTGWAELESGFRRWLESPAAAGDG